jgi:hypothetical protein
MSWVAWLRFVANWWRTSLVVIAGVGAVIVLLAGGTLPADGETGPSSGTGGAECSSSNPSNVVTRVAGLTAGVGATQSTRTGTRFPLQLAVTVTDAEKSPVPGVLVTFMAPTHGPSGSFTIRSAAAGHARTRTSHPRRVEVRSDACGIALAPMFTANHRQGGYVVVASVEDARAAFALVNER